MSTLYVVSTPIGNLDDLTRRTETTLGSVDRILAEDTRRTRKLLHHLGLTIPLVSLHAHNEAGRREAVLGWLDAGEDLALVSDAGTPLVSDPGARIVEAAMEGGHRVVPLPGPSAVTTALSASGFSGDRFTFLGFPPRKGTGRQELLDRVARAREPVVLFESPERLDSLLDELEEACGEDRPAVVGREMTKVHEEFRRGSLGELQAHFRDHPPRGEITLVLAPGEGRPEAGGMDRVDEVAARALARALLGEGRSPSRAARELAARLDVPRNRAYEIVLSVSSGEEGGTADLPDEGSP